MNKKIILIGPTASGKNVLRDRLHKKGFTFDISYTTRDIRHEVGEVDGVDYHFITDEEFKEKEAEDGFYEKVEYNGKRYGTGRKEWESKDVFIMEPEGVNCILREDRDSCFIIYINPPKHIRVNRMKDERKWNDEQINARLTTDSNKFKLFGEYDIKITTPDF